MGVNPLPSPDERPTKIEAKLYFTLDMLGIDYERQKSFQPYYVDAYLPKWHVAIEADGCKWHSCPTCPGARRDPERLAHDARREIILRQRYGLTMRHIWGHNLLTNTLAMKHVSAALADFGVTPVALPTTTTEW